jgi:hypothetical protein
MRSVTLTLDNDWKMALHKAGNHFKQAWKTGEYQGEFIGFANPALLSSICHQRGGKFSACYKESPKGLHQTT